MTIKQQELQQMQARMYERLESVRENFTSFSPLEKAFFAQQAFNDVNAYFCKKYNIPEDRVAFGFMLGRRCGGIMQPFQSKHNKNESHPGISMNLLHITTVKDPYEIYRDTIHEWYHVLQFEKKIILGKALQQHLYPKNWEKNQTLDRWLASPKEIEADFGARKEILGIIKTGLSNPETRVQACKQLEFYRQEKTDNFMNHLKGTANAIVGAFVKSNKDGKNNQPRVGEAMGRPPACFNLLEIASVVGEVDPLIKDPIQLCKIMRDFSKPHNPAIFNDVNFFVYNRAFHQNANRIAMDLYQKEGLSVFGPPTFKLSVETTYRLAEALKIGEEGAAQQPNSNIQQSNIGQEQKEESQQSNAEQSNATQDVNGDAQGVGNPELTREILNHITEEKNTEQIAGASVQQDPAVSTEQSVAVESTSDVCAPSLDIAPAMELTE